MHTIEESLLNKVEEFLATHRISLTDGILVAFSGGADSLSLLSLLRQCYPKDYIKALYVNHRLRDEIELIREVDQNRAVCTSLDVDFILIEAREGEIEQLSKERKNGLEEAARFYRYARLEEIRKRLTFSYIATAHNKNDQSETLLMRLFQGSRHNFSAPIQEQAGSLIRPLLGITRGEIEEYLTEKQLQWVEDPTNNEHLYLRNKIRHLLVPTLKDIFPRWDDGLSRLSDEMEQLNEYVDGVAREASAKSVRKLSDEEIVLDIKYLTNFPPVILRRVLYYAYNQLSFVGRLRLPSQSVDDIVTIIQGKRKSSRIDLAHSFLTFSNSEMKWRKGKEALGVFYFSLVYSNYTHLHHSYYLVRQGKMSIKEEDKETIWIDDECIVGQLAVRSYQSHDTIELKEGTKSVSSLFASWHIEASVRWEIPILVDDIGVIAIFGRCFRGKDRVSKRVFLSPLAGKLTTLYSIKIIEG